MSAPVPALRVDVAATDGRASVRLCGELDLERDLPVEPAQNSVGVPDSIPRSSS